MKSEIAVPKPKPKRKNSEKRKEKSRNAARERRSQESDIFDEIEALLPVPAKTLEHLDKASLIRLAINYVKTRSLVDFLNVPESSDLFDASELSTLQSLDGFVMVIGKDGSLAYVSENIERLLGLNSIDLLGHSLYDYAHPCDHADLKAFLEPLQCTNDNCFTSPAGPNYVRMKCTLTAKGRSLNLKSAKYMTVKLTGKTLDLQAGSVAQAKGFDATFEDYIVAMGELLPAQALADVPLGGDVFISKHSPDMKFTYVDNSVTELFGYAESELLGTSFYELFDPTDFALMNAFFKTLFAKGQCDSGHYRLPVKSGGHRWISTQSILITKPNCAQPDSVLLIHRVLSNIENAHCVTSALQQTGAVGYSVCRPEVGIAAAVAGSDSVCAAAESAATSLPTAAAGCLVPEVEQLTDGISGFSVEDSLLTADFSLQGLDPLSQLNQPPAESSTAAILAQSSFGTGSSATSAIANAGSSSTLDCLTAGSVDFGEDLNDFVGQRSTQSVVVRKTADMESGFLMFTESCSPADEEDLTHLAPSSDDFVADLAMPGTLSDMNLADLSLLEDLFLAGASSSTSSFSSDGLSGSLGSSGFSVPDDDDDLLGSLEEAFSDNEKLKFDAFDSFDVYDRFNGKSSANAFERQFALANDPFMAFDGPAELLASSASPSSCSLSDLYSSNSSSPITSPGTSAFYAHLPAGSAGHAHFAGKDGAQLCDSEHDRDAEMRAPFIPIDDDFLLNDLATYSDANNIDDFFSWISSSGGVAYLPHGDTTTKGSGTGTGNGPANNATSGAQKAKSNLTGSCLESLLQRDDLVSCLKGRQWNSNELSGNGTMVFGAQRSASNYSKAGSVQQSKSQPITIQPVNNSNTRTNTTNHATKPTSGLTKTQSNGSSVSSLKSELLLNTSNGSNGNATKCYVNSMASNTATAAAVVAAAAANKRKNIASNIVILAKPSIDGKKLKALPNKSIVFTDAILTTTATGSSPATIGKPQTCGILIANSAGTGSGTVSFTGNGTSVSSNSNSNGNGTDKQTVHHFVLTKNKQLIPRSDFADQTIKISSKRVLTTEGQALAEFAKEETPSKKARIAALERTYSNSVLMNLLVNGLDLAHGYELNTCAGSAAQTPAVRSAPINRSETQFFLAN